MSSINPASKNMAVSSKDQTSTDISSSEKTIKRSDIDGKVNKNTTNSFIQDTDLNLRIKSKIIYNDMKEIKKIRVDFLKITEVIENYVENIYAHHKNQSSNNNLNINNYLSKYLSKNDSDIVIEISKIYFLNIIENKIINFISTEKEEYNEFEFLCFSELITSFKSFYNLSADEVPYVRYNAMTFINKTKTQTQKITQDKIDLNELSKSLNDSSINQQIVKKITHCLQKTITNKEAENSQKNINFQLDLTNIHDTLYFFTTDQNQIQRCNNIITKSSTLDRKSKINYLIESMNREFDTDNFNNSFISNYQLINHRVIYFNNQIANLQLQDENKYFLKNILYAHLFSKIEKHINLLIDSSSLLLDIKISVISEIVKNSNTIGLDCSQKFQVLNRLIKYSQEIYGENAQESFTELFPKFNFKSVFASNNIINKNNLYSTKLIKLIREDKTQHNGKIQFFNTSYAEILDILNSDVYGVHSLESKDEIKFQDKYSLNELINLHILRDEINIENSLNIDNVNQNIKDENKAIELILTAENFVHNAISLNKNNENGKLLINALNADNKEEIEFVFKAVADYLEIQKSNDIKSTEMKLFYEHMLYEIMCKRVDDILNNIINSVILTNMQKITYIDRIDYACKQVMGLAFFKKRSNSIAFIKKQSDKLLLMDLKQWVTEDSENINKFNFFHKFSNLINGEVYNLIKLDNFNGIQEGCKNINNIYINQMTNFAEIFNLNKNDTKMILSSCKSITDFITDIEEITKSDTFENTNNNFIKLNASLSKSVLSALNAFNKHYIRINYLTSKKTEIKQASMFIMMRYFKYFMNSLALFIENFRYKFHSTKINNKTTRNFYESNEYIDYPQDLFYVKTYFDNQSKNISNNIISTQKAKDIAENISHMDSMFRKEMIANINQKVQNLNVSANIITNVAEFIFKDGTALDEMSNICLLNLTIDNLLANKPKVKITELNLIEEYYSLLCTFTDLKQDTNQPKFLDIDGFIKFKKNINALDASYLETPTNSLYADILRKDYIVANKQAHFIGVSILKKINHLKAGSNKTEIPLKEFIIEFNGMLQDDTITQHLTKTGNKKSVFEIKHEENIFKMQLIIDYLTNEIQINSMYLTIFIEILFKLIVRSSYNEEYDYNRLNIELEMIYQQISSNKKNYILNSTIREISSRLLTLI